MKQQIIPKVNLAKLKKKYDKVWQKPVVAKRQLALTEVNLPNYKNDKPTKGLLDFVRQITNPEDKVLEIGCSTGYHGEIFRKERINITYEGCDYSKTFIDIAIKKYPNIKFQVCDARKLIYKDNLFNLVISGCCLLHIVDYQKAIKETVRVAKKYVLFYRTPIIHETGTTFTKKIGYGQEMVEILFDEKEFVKELAKENLAIIGVDVCGKLDKVIGVEETVYVKSYLCQKISNQG